MIISTSPQDTRGDVCDNCPDVSNIHQIDTDEVSATLQKTISLSQVTDEYEPAVSNVRPPLFHFSCTPPPRQFGP